MLGKKGLFTVLVLITIFTSALAQTEEFRTESTTTNGANWEQMCTGSICQVSFYSYEKYMYDESNEEWMSVDETFSSCSVNDVAGFCPPSYYYDAHVDENGTITVSYDGETVAFGLLELPFSDNEFAQSASLEDNSIIYRDIIPNYVDLKYTFLPRKIKEELIIKQPVSLEEFRNFDIVFSRIGSLETNRPWTICDANTVCMEMEASHEEGRLILHIPENFLENPTIAYPLIIDPLLELNSSDIAWNGRIVKNDPTEGWQHTRDDNPSLLHLGIIGSFMGTPIYAQGDIDFNISVIPDDVTILNASLDVYVLNASQNSSLFINHMGGNSFTYPDGPDLDIDDNCIGNCLFYNDIADGTSYFSRSFNLSSNFLLNATFSAQGVADVQNALSTDIFSTGLHVPTTPTVTIAARDYSTPSQRPVLRITYEISNSSVQQAILEGINHSLPGNPASSEKQIYLVNEFGQHSLGRFDQVTTLDNQTWAFNYVGLSESFINMSSLFRVLNVWQNQSLAYEEIANQVEVFINATIV